MLRDTGLYHHLHCAKIDVEMRESLMIAWRNQALNYGETKTSSSLSEPLHTKPASSQVPVQLLLLGPINLFKHLHASFSQSKPSVPFKTVKVLSLGSDSSFSASSEVLWFWISTVLSIESCWWQEFSNWKTSSGPYVWIYALGLTYSVLGDKRRRCGTT